MTLKELKENRIIVASRLDHVHNRKDMGNTEALLAVSTAIDTLLKLDKLIYDAEKPMERVKLGPGKPG